MLKDSKQARIDFLDQLEMKRKYFKSSYQTSNPVKEGFLPLSSSIASLNPNSGFSNEQAKQIRNESYAIKKHKKGKMFGKATVRDIISNDYVNSFAFPDIKSSVHRFGDASRLTGFTAGTNEDIPSHFNDQTIEYYV